MNSEHHAPGLFIHAQGTREISNACDPGYVEIYTKLNGPVIHLTWTAQDWIWIPFQLPTHGLPGECGCCDLGSVQVQCFFHSNNSPESRCLVCTLCGVEEPKNPISSNQKKEQQRNPKDSKQDSKHLWARRSCGNDGAAVSVWYQGGNQLMFPFWFR